MSKRFDHSSTHATQSKAMDKSLQHERSLSASKLLFFKYLTSSNCLSVERGEKSQTSVIKRNHSQYRKDVLQKPLSIVKANDKVASKKSQRPQGIFSRQSTTSAICCILAGDCDSIPDQLDLQGEIESPRRRFSCSTPISSENLKKPALESFSEESKHGKDFISRRCELIQIEPKEKLTEVKIEEPNTQDLEIARICSALADNERYKTIKKKKYTMQYRKEKNKTITLKFAGELEIELKNLFKLLYEPQIYNMWFPNCRRATLVHSFNINERMIKSQVMTPGLMADRQNIMLSIFADRLKSKDCIYLLARSVHHLQEIKGVPVPKLAKGKVKLDVQYFGFQIQPTSRKSAIIRSVFNFCPHVKFVPQWLLNIVNRHFGKMLFERMIKYSLSLKGTKIEKKLATLEEGQFYETMNKKLLQHYERKEW